MPKISEFFGIIIYMYWNDTKRHKKPHIHVIFDNKQAVFSLEGEYLAGNIGRRASRLTLEFINERQVELHEAWKCAIANKEIPWIKLIS